MLKEEIDSTMAVDTLRNSGHSIRYANENKTWQLSHKIVQGQGRHLEVRTIKVKNFNLRMIAVHVGVISSAGNLFVYFRGKKVTTNNKSNDNKHQGRRRERITTFLLLLLFCD